MVDATGAAIENQSARPTGYSNNKHLGFLQENGIARQLPILFVAKT